MKIQPLNDRVLVLRIEEEQKTSGGIIIPDTAKEKPQERKVIAVGPAIDQRGSRLEAGERHTERSGYGQARGSG